MWLDASHLIHLTLFDALTKSFWRSWLNRFPSNSHPKKLLGYCAYDLLKVLGEIHLIDPTLIALPGCWGPIYGTSEGPCVLASDVRGLFSAFDEKIFIPGKLRLQLTWRKQTISLSLSLSLAPSDVPTEGARAQPAEKTHSARGKHKLKLRHQLVHPLVRDGGNFAN